MRLNTSHPLNKGRMLWLRSDPGDGGLTLSDLVRGQQATLVGTGSGQGLVASHRNGHPRTVFANANTSGAHANLLGQSPIPFTQSTWTLAIWVYFRTINNSRQSPFFRGGASSGQMGILVNGPAPGSSIWRAQANGSTINASAIQPGNWYRFMVTGNGTAIRMFKNGVLDTTGTAAGTWGPEDVFQIGNDTPSSRPIDGLVDSVSIWDYPLPDAFAWDDYTEELTGCRSTLIPFRPPLWAPATTAPPSTLPWMIDGDFPSYGYVEA